VADAKTYINGLSANDGTDYDDAAALAPDAFDDPGKLSTPGVRNVSYFLSDGQPEPTDEQVSGSELTSWINFVNANDIVSYAIGLGSSATDTYLDPLAYDGTGSGTDTDALIVTNLDQLQSTLVGTVSPSISGSVIDGSIPTSFGADGGYVKSIAIGGKTYSYNPTTDQVTESSSGGQSAYSFNTATNKLTITFSGSVGESFVIDLDDGSYVYTPPTNIVADFSRPFTYTLTDNDGDTASSTLTINVNNVNEVAAVNDIIRTNFDGTAFDVPEWALLFNDTTESGTLDITGVSNESSLDVTNPAGNVVNIDDDGSTANGGSFDYTASNGTSTGTGSVQVFNKNGGGNVTGTSANEILVGDGDGDTFDGGSGVDIILAGGGSDTIVADQNDHVLDGGSGTDTLRVGSNFTSSSNAHIANIENVTLTAAVTLNLANQTEAFTITGSSGADVITGGAGADTITGGAGGDRMTGGSGAGVVDTFVIGSGQTTLSIGGSGNNGTISGYDTITDFNLAVDKLSLNGTPFAASNTSGTNGSNSSLTIGGNQISSHAITNGIIRFDDSGTFSTALTLDSTQDVAAVVDYLRHNDLGSAGATVAFTATIGGVNHTYIYQQVGNGPSTTNDILVDLENVTLTSGGTSLATLIGNGHVDPIVLDLGDQGISFSSIGEGVQFDINADGASDQVAWTVNGQDGILALDVDGSGKIEGGKELFTPNFNGGQFADGIAALASLDGNHDGVIDGQDQAFGELVVWQDANHNGVSETDELAKLGDLGITGISLNTTPGGAPIDGQNIAGTGSFTYADGSTGTFVEVDLDASLGTASAQPDSNPAEDHDLTVFTAVAAEIDYGGGDIDLSGLLQPGADHAPAPQTQGAETAHAGVDAGATTPAAITIMHEQAALAMQLAAS
jgi:RTX calcium-binding nonapeptide repeat (4 copies)